MFWLPNAMATSTLALLLLLLLAASDWPLPFSNTQLLLVFFIIFFAFLALSFLWSFLFLFMGTSFINCVHDSATAFFPAQTPRSLRQSLSLTFMLTISDSRHLRRPLSWNSKLHRRIHLPSFLLDISIWKSRGNLKRNHFKWNSSHPSKSISYLLCSVEVS